MNEFRFSPRPNRAARDRLDAVGRASLRACPIRGQADSALDFGGLVPLVPRYGRDVVLRPGRDRRDQSQRYVPIRVDNDRRPDVNARYNMGGWPTTAFLAPDGTTLTGATYLPPQQFRRALDEIARFYAERKDEIAQHVAELETRARKRPPQSSADLDRRPDRRAHRANSKTPSTKSSAASATRRSFRSRKLLEFLLSEWRLSGRQRLYAMVAKTMLAMARGGMYDHVEGGFFRYSTTRDWSVPHFEKMAEDHAGLLRVLCRARALRAHQRVSRNVGFDDELRAPRFARSTDRILCRKSRRRRSVLRAAARGTAQARGAVRRPHLVYELDLRARRRAVPRGARARRRCACSTKRCSHSITSHERLVGRRRACSFTCSRPAARPRCAACFADQVAYARALLDAHEISGETRFLSTRARDCDAVIANFESPEGGFYDRLRGEKILDGLTVADRPIIDNGLFAEALLRLSGLTGDVRYRERAAIAFCGCIRGVRAAPELFAATYARALRRYFARRSAVRIVGDAGGDGCLSRSGAAPSDTVCGDSNALARRSRGTARNAGRTAGCIRMRYRSLRRSGSRCGWAARCLRCALLRSKTRLRGSLGSHEGQPVPAAPETGSDRIRDQGLPQRGKRSRTASIISATRNGSKSSAWRIPNCAKPFT